MWEHIGRIADILVVVGPAAWWVVRWLRRIALDTYFVRDVAKTHLPNIYTRLHRVDGEEHPSIVYVNGLAAPGAGQRL